jgi:RecB family endonuclease NucS
MESAIRENNWKPVIDALQSSERLLMAMLRGDAEAVACGVEKAHRENTSLFKYNDENAMACVLSLAFYNARNDFHMHREYQTGDGYADLVLIPRKNVNKPAVVIELKYDKAVDTAIDQIKRKHYPEKVQEYMDDLNRVKARKSDADILLVGICYDKETKVHTCCIEHFHK